VFYPSNFRLRYFACESLYNVTKAVRTLLVDDHFNSLFITVSRLNSDGDQNVRSGAELLDRLLKDIVTESNVAPNISVLLRERIYVLDSQGRSFVAGWITHLSGNPHTGLSDVLPALVDGLFQVIP
jgi:vacuole morphology and inheritance protein 14